MESNWMEAWADRYEAVGATIKRMVKVGMYLVYIAALIIYIWLCTVIAKMDVPFLFIILTLVFVIFIYIITLLTLMIYGFGILVEKSEGTSSNAPQKKISKEQKEMISTLKKWVDEGLITQKEYEQKLKQIEEQ